MMILFLILLSGVDGSDTCNSDCEQTNGGVTLLQTMMELSSSAGVPTQVPLVDDGTPGNLDSISHETITIAGPPDPFPSIDKVSTHRLPGGLPALISIAGARRPEAVSDAPIAIATDSASQSKEPSQISDARVDAPGIADAKPNHPDNVRYVAYFMSFILMVSLIANMYRSMGFIVICQIVTYVTCIVFVKLVMKCVFDYGYRYPVFVTSVHLSSSSLCGFLVLLYRQQTMGTPILVPTLHELCWFIAPITFSFAISIGCENSALVFVSAAFAEVVGACNPVMAAFVTVASGIEFRYQLLAPMAVVVAGCLVSVEGEKYFSSVGLALLVTSAFCRSLKAVLQEKLMTGETKDRFDPVTLMAWACGFSSLQMYAYSVASEGLAPVRALVAAPDLLGLSLTILCSAAIACCLNMSGLFVNKQLGAVGMQLVSQLKSVLVVSGGVILLHESFTRMQKMGFVITLVGVYWYSSMKQRLSSSSTPSGEAKGP